MSARVAGKSAGGYDLYVVTVTAPESRAEAQRQERWKRQIEEDPARARADRQLLRDYKTPLFVNANIHGNEWEGTDAALRVIEEYASSTDPAVRTLLQRNRLVFNITSNPDGRVAGTYLHGLFASDPFRRAFLGSNASPDLAYEAGVEQALDDLAAHLEKHLDIDALLALAEEIQN